MHQRKPRDRKHVNEFSGTLGDGHKNERIHCVWAV